MSEAKQYTGTKVVLGTPMNRLAYNQYRGWELPADENGDDEGYLVEYLDGGKANHPDHKGYISWSPKDVFERAYKPSATPLERMEIELEELDARIEKLGSALGSRGFMETVGIYQYNLMVTQHHAMCSYRGILMIRINDLNEKK